MLYVHNDSTNPYFNLAVEEYVLKNLHLDDSFILLWQNRPSIIVGRNQNTLEEINYDYVKENDIFVVRRLSGGGAVYHDLGNLNFTFITKRDDSAVANFKKFTEPVIKVLQDLGVPAEFSGRNDITIDGKKFSGNAQYYYQDRVLHHGTILFDSDLEEVQKALNVKADKIKSKGVKSVRSRVTNIIDYLPEKISIAEFKDILRKKIFSNAEIPYSDYKLQESDLDAINKLVDERYGTWEWNYGRSPEFNFKKERRFNAGKIEVLLNVKKGVIEQCKIYGDFFGVDDVVKLEQMLAGKKYKEEEIKSLLEAIDIRRFFGEITSDEFLELLF